MVHGGSKRMTAFFSQLPQAYPTFIAPKQLRASNPVAVVCDRWGGSHFSFCRDVVLTGQDPDACPPSALLKLEGPSQGLVQFQGSSERAPQSAQSLSPDSQGFFTAGCPGWHTLAQPPPPVRAEGTGGGRENSSCSPEGWESRPKKH